MRVASIIYTHSKTRASLLLSSGQNNGLPNGIPLTRYTFPSLSGFLDSAAFTTKLISRFTSPQQPGSVKDETQHSLEEHNMTENPTGNRMSDSNDAPYSTSDPMLIEVIQLLAQYEKDGVDIYDVWLLDSQNLTLPPELLSPSLSGIVQESNETAVNPGANNFLAPHNPLASLRLSPPFSDAEQASPQIEATPDT